MRVTPAPRSGDSWPDLPFSHSLKQELDDEGAGDEDAELGRQALYRSLSKQGNPELETLTRVLRQLGFRLAVEGAA